VQRYKYEAEAAVHEAKEIRSQALPQVSFQMQRQVGSAVVPGYPSYNMAGFVVNYVPGGGLSSAVAASAAFERANAAKLQVETARRELADRLNADYNEYEFAVLKKESLQRSVDLTSDISASYDRQYLVGRKSWLDLMNSVREQAQTKVQFADAEGSQIGASRRLMIYIEGTKMFDVTAEPQPKQLANNKKK
jgi:adhesin transport system outer membrane protein